MERLEVKNCSQTKSVVFVIVLVETLLQNDRSLRYFACGELVRSCFLVYMYVEQLSPQTTITCMHHNSMVHARLMHEGIVKDSLHSQNFIHNYCVKFLFLGWHGGLMVSALDSGSNGPGSSLGQGTTLCS